MIRAIRRVLPAACDVSDWADYSIAVVIPCYNEARHIGQVLSSLPAWVRHVIVVDDCSRDDSAEVIEELAKSDDRIVLVRHTRNSGVGGAMVSGYRAALELGAQIVVKMDGDGQMSPDDLPRLAGQIAQLPRLRLRGLMTLPLPQQACSPHPFVRLADLLDRLNGAGHRLDTLSMGMSDDFEAAIAAGATLIRIGSALFGQRPTPFTAQTQYG